MTERAEALRIAAAINVLGLMGRTKKKTVTLDVVPPRGEVIVPRIDEADDSLTAPAPTIQTLHYVLEDQMFGGVLYAAVTCEGFIVVEPFKWESWDALARYTISVG